VYHVDVSSVNDTDIEAVTLLGTITASNANVAFTTANVDFTA
jgi:hypothetical protein